MKIIVFLCTQFSDISLIYLMTEGFIKQAAVTVPTHPSDTCVILLITCNLFV